MKSSVAAAIVQTSFGGRKFLFRHPGGMGIDPRSHLHRLQRLHSDFITVLSIEMTYYLVFEGRVPGFYEEWEDCKKHVHNFSGNCYKGYTTRQEAVAKWWKQQSNKSKMKTFIVLPLLLTIVAAVLYFILV
ncbi:hypothetical protein QYE76_071825 [Lolium multiflorum]|uniref:Ribonuclease H1 N-terminal domain-containing protein n=1 Tax=Lolium multiflorum TaxID=4521 RepID=A0AAD8WFR9_LOLMU|nr:hypothetical protein QYE76_071825 [Lolium multiflorum]